MKTYDLRLNRSIPISVLKEEQSVGVSADANLLNYGTLRKCRPAACATRVEIR